MKNVIKTVAKEFDVNQTLAKDLIGTVFASVIKELKDNGSIRISNFGTLTAIAKPARKARNPKTGETIDVAAKTIVKFKPATFLNDEIQ